MAPALLHLQQLQVCHAEVTSPQATRASDWRTCRRVICGRVLMAYTPAGNKMCISVCLPSPGSDGRIKVSGFNGEQPITAERDLPKHALSRGNTHTPIFTDKSMAEHRPPMQLTNNGTHNPQYKFILLSNHQWAAVIRRCFMFLNVLKYLKDPALWLWLSSSGWLRNCVFVMFLPWPH